MKVKHPVLLNKKHPLVEISRTVEWLQLFASLCNCTNWQIMPRISNKLQKLKVEMVYIGTWFIFLYSYLTFFWKIIKFTYVKR